VGQLVNIGEQLGLLKRDLPQPGPQHQRQLKPGNVVRSNPANRRRPRPGGISSKSTGNGPHTDASNAA